MPYDDFTIAIAAGQGGVYPASAVDRDFGRVAATLPTMEPLLLDLLATLAGQAVRLATPGTAREAGEALFRWLIAGPLETHFRLSWDRAARRKRGLRLRLSIDPPELASLPWELLHDPIRDHTLATSASTPVVRFLDRADTFGSIAQSEAEFPLAMLLVLPDARGLETAREQVLIEDAIAPLRGALTLYVLEGPVTRSALSDSLMVTPFDIVHITTHGGVLADDTYIQLNGSDGTPDWVDAASFVRLFTNARSLKLIVLNACHSGQVASNRAFSGYAPQLLRAGVPAVVAMQYVIAEDAAQTFAREFYRQLCTGQQAGQVDIAAAHARNMLAALHPDGLAFAAPVLYTHASDGVIYRLPEAGTSQAAADPSSESARLAMFMNSLQASMDFVDDWEMAGCEQLEMWHRTLLWAERAYSLHLNDTQPTAQQAARHGLAMTQSRIHTIEKRMQQDS